MHGVGEVYGKCNAKYLVQGAYLEPQTITSSCGQIQDLNLKWVGDLSLQDAHLLHHRSKGLISTDLCLQCILLV